MVRHTDYVVKFIQLIKQWQAKQLEMNNNNIKLHIFLKYQLSQEHRNLLIIYFDGCNCCERHRHNKHDISDIPQYNSEHECSCICRHATRMLIRANRS